MKKEQTKTSPPGPKPLTFSQSIMLPPPSPGAMSVIIPAGEPSPFRTLDEVPESLRSLIGKPSPRPVEPPSPYKLQHFVSDAELAAEREAFRQLADGDDLDPELKAELEYRDAQYLKDAAARNKTLEEIAQRHDEALDRVAKEHEQENRRIYGRRPMAKESL